jgi:hypothetical protein
VRIRNSGRGKILAALVAVAAIGIGGFAAVSVGDGGTKPPNRIKLEPDFRVVKNPKGAAASALAQIGKTKGFKKVATMETRPFDIPTNTATDVTGKCRRGWISISGYFDTDGLIFADSFVTTGNRGWSTGLVNVLIDEPGQAIVGIICMK